MHKYKSCPSGLFLALHPFGPRHNIALRHIPVLMVNVLTHDDLLGCAYTRTEVVPLAKVHASLLKYIGYLASSVEAKVYPLFTLYQLVEVARHGGNAARYQYARYSVDVDARENAHFRNVMLTQFSIAIDTMQRREIYLICC